MENAQIIDLVKKVSEERSEIAFSKIFDFIAPKINGYYIQNNLSIEQAEELEKRMKQIIDEYSPILDGVDENDGDGGVYDGQVLHQALE